MKYCARCAMKYQDNMNFCPNCGDRLYHDESYDRAAEAERLATERERIQKPARDEYYRIKREILPVMKGHDSVIPSNYRYDSISDYSEEIEKFRDFADLIYYHRKHTRDNLFPLLLNKFTEVEKKYRAMIAIYNGKKAQANEDFRIQLSLEAVKAYLYGGVYSVIVSEKTEWVPNLGRKTVRYMKKYELSEGAPERITDDVLNGKEDFGFCYLYINRELDTLLKYVNDMTQYLSNNKAPITWQIEICKSISKYTKALESYSKSFYR